MGKNLKDLNQLSSDTAFITGNIKRDGENCLSGNFRDYLRPFFTNLSSKCQEVWFPLRAAKI